MDESVFLYDAGEETRYELVKELRRGGEGRIWRAWQHGAAGRRLAVALKVLTPDVHLGGWVDKDEILAKWREQAQVMRNFSHDGFVPVQVVFKVADPPGEAAPAWMVGLPAFVMAWADGRNLADWSRAEPDAMRRLAILERCAAGLDAFHQETQHVHRDIKPDNVVVVRGGFGRLVDYGLVRSFEQQRRLSTLTGTYGYLAPELEDGAPYSAATDLYAFAAVIFHQLTLHKPPATRRGWSGTARQLLVDAGCERAASPVLLALHPDPGSRPHLAGAAELLARVQACVAPVPVRPAPSPPRGGSDAESPLATSGAALAVTRGREMTVRRMAVVVLVPFAVTLLFAVVVIWLSR